MPREPLEQNRHDTIITILAKQLESDNKDVRVNPNNTNQNGIKADSEMVYPDLFVVDRDYVTEIYEVESETTINESSLDQWRKYSRISPKFYLVIPEKSVEATKNLVAKANIKVEGYYTWI